MPCDGHLTERIFSWQRLSKTRSFLMFPLWPRAHTLAKKLLYLILDDDCYACLFKLALCFACRYNNKLCDNDLDNF